MLAALALAVALATAGGVAWGTGHQMWGALCFVLSGLSTLVGGIALLAILTDAPQLIAPANRRETILALYRLRDAVTAFVGHGTRGQLYVTINLPPNSPDWESHGHQWTALYNELTAAKASFDAESDTVGAWFAGPAKEFSLECIQDWEKKLGSPNEHQRNRAIQPFFARVDEVLDRLNHPPVRG